MSKNTSNVVGAMKKQEEARNERRRVAEEQKQAKIERANMNAAAGKVCDVDFEFLIQDEMKKVGAALNHVPSN